MFRTKSLNFSRNRLSGDIAIAVPLSWQAIGYFTLVAIALGVASLSFATYSRVETAIGAITPDAGVSAIIPTRSGVISSVSVTDGQTVSVGTELATIRTEEEGVSTQSPSALVQAAIALQDVSLATQADASHASAKAQAAQLAAQRLGLQARIGMLHLSKNDACGACLSRYL